MNVGNQKNQYKIPRYIIFLSAFLIPISIVIIVLLIVINVLELLPRSSFIFEDKWFDLLGNILIIPTVIIFLVVFQYPLKRWIINNVKCSECGNKITKCRYNYQYNKAMMSFKVYCQSCQKNRVIETGRIDRNLRFKDESLI